jgi:hypothetical protein
MTRTNQIYDMLLELVKTTVPVHSAPRGITAEEKK